VSWPWSSWGRRRILRRLRISDGLWFSVLRTLPVLRALDEPAADRLRELSTLFLHAKRFEAVRGASLDESTRTIVAAQACLPILELGLEWYAGWRDIVVYPGPFRAHRHEVDDAGVHHEWEEDLDGESWQRGPVILSAADLDVTGECDGFNVVIHEMAHKIDMLSDGPNGCPPLHRGMDARAWHNAFSRAYENLASLVESGVESEIDSYAAHDPGEFFAVTSEYFFELPGILQRCYPQVYAQLSMFYRQDPARRLA